MSCLVFVLSSSLCLVFVLSCLVSQTGDNNNVHRAAAKPARAIELVIVSVVRVRVRVRDKVKVRVRLGVRFRVTFLVANTTPLVPGEEIYPTRREDGLGVRMSGEGREKK